MTAVTYGEVQELIQGRGRKDYEAQHPTIFNIVLGRLMDDRDPDMMYDDLHDQLTEAGYELDRVAFMDACYGRMDAMSVAFVRGVVDVLGLDQEEMQAFAWAHLFGTE